MLSGEDIWPLETFLFVPVGKGNALDIHWLETEETANSPVTEDENYLAPHGSKAKGERSWTVGLLGSKK